MKKLILSSICLLLAVSGRAAETQELMCFVGNSAPIVAFAILTTKGQPKDVLRFNTTNYEGDMTPNSETKAKIDVCQTSDQQIRCQFAISTFNGATATIGRHAWDKSLQTKQIFATFKKHDDANNVKAADSDDFTLTMAGDFQIAGCKWIDELPSHRALIEAAR